MNVYLHRKRWQTVGASHYHGDLVSDAGTLIVSHELTAREAAKLNDAERGLQFSFTYRPGMNSAGFDAPDELTRAAVALFAERFGPEDILFDGPQYKDPPILARGNLT